MTTTQVNIHTHHPTQTGVELRTTGIHPWEASERRVEELLPLPSDVQAIGEIGLDARRGAPFHVQLQLFREQLALAHQSDLPVVLHCVHTFEQTMNELAEFPLRAVIFHGFIGSSEQVLRAVERGYYLSFGERTFASPKTCDALRATPLDRIFCETDQSEATIGSIYARTANERGVEIEILTQAIWENYIRIFAKQ